MRKPGQPLIAAFTLEQTAAIYNKYKRKRGEKRISGRSVQYIEQSALQKLRMAMKGFR